MGAYQRLRNQGLASYRIATKHYREFVRAKEAGKFDAAAMAFNNYKVFKNQFERQLDRAAKLARGGAV